MHKYDYPSPAELEENKRSLARMIENDKRRSGEMANTLPLKGNEETPLESSSLSSGSTCKCGHELYTHRGSNTECHGVDISKPKTYTPSGVINWSDPNIWCKCKKYEPQSNEKDR